VVEWAQAALTPFGTWAAAGHSFLDDLPLLQLASVVGIAGVGIAVHVAAGALELALDRGVAGARRELATALGVLALAHAAGTVRLAVADDATPSTVQVAAVATDSDIVGLPLPARARTEAWDDAIFERTRRAAQGGAELVVWPEAGALVWPDREGAWNAALGALARETRADIVAGYLVPRGEGGSEGYRNELRVALRDGTVLEPYAKHHPVPGEPATPGVGPAPVIDRPWGRLSGALCYDYDFPGSALERARAGVDLVALPSSDWRGIDPTHSAMAAVRAIESGHSILRSTRWGLSAAVDPYGRIRARQSAFERGPGVLHASLPTSRVPTLYALWGDVPLLLFCGALLGTVALGRLRARRRLPVASPGARWW
jgi:apolipoprotein N-acyltransferase